MTRKFGLTGLVALFGVVLALSLPVEVAAQTTDDTIGGSVLDKDGTQSDRGGPPRPGSAGANGNGDDGPGPGEADPNSFDIDSEGDLEFERQDRPQRSPGDAWRRFVLLWIATMTRFATFPGH